MVTEGNGMWAKSHLDKKLPMIFVQESKSCKWFWYTGQIASRSFAGKKAAHQKTVRINVLSGQFFCLTFQDNDLNASIIDLVIFLEQVSFL